MFDIGFFELLIVAVVGLFVAAALWSPFEAHPPAVIEGAFDRPVEEPTWPEADWDRFEETIRWALEQRVDTLSLGDAMAEIGRSFVGRRTCSPSDGTSDQCDCGNGKYP